MKKKKQSPYVSILIGIRVKRFAVNSRAVDAVVEHIGPIRLTLLIKLRNCDLGPAV